MRGLNWRALLFAAGVITGTSLITIRAQALYTSHHLGVNHQVHDLNDHGEMVGEYLGTIQHGILSDGAAWIPTGLNGDDFDWSALYGINNNHYAVGLNTVRPEGITSLTVHAVRVHRDTPFNLVNLGSLTGENGNARARAINNANVAVGDSADAVGRRRAVRFDVDGEVTDLGSLGGDNSTAIDINDRGDIAGESSNFQGQTRGFFLGEDGILRDIGTLGGEETFVTRMTAQGEIGGLSMTIARTTRAFVYANGEMKDLGTLGGRESVAYGINDAGVIVGAAMKTNGAYTAFIKYPGQPMVDLASLVRVPFPDALIYAKAIDNRGMIIARGSKDASNYMLKPGAFTLEIRGDVLAVEFAAPPNTEVILETSQSLTTWTPFLTNTIATEPILIERPLNSDPSFFRATVSLSSN
ncbi:MAG TPA: hypothetical protein VM735_01630 [Candidatus Kapabacteria bacterium]|nr:hypothetical protein [Candidatus Kapabacteria bacterium]